MAKWSAPVVSYLTASPLCLSAVAQVVSLAMSWSYSANTKLSEGVFIQFTVKCTFIPILKAQEPLF